MSFWTNRSKSVVDQSNPVDQARASIRQLSEKGVEIPSLVTRPIMEAQKVGDLKNASPELQQKFWSAYGTLNSKIKSPEEAKDYYRKFFYGILSALLVLQLYYSAFVAVQKGLLDVGKDLQAAEIASVVSDSSTKAPTKRDELAGRQLTYLHATEYLMGFPRTVASFLGVLGMGPDQPKVTDRAEIVAQVELELATSFVGGFLLPVLYGMLGAIAFVLRRLSDETLVGEEARTLKRRYSLRVPIGALSGLAAGWLLQPAAGSVTGSLSPFALAFVAGYSADLVFAAMDRVVAAFSSPAPPVPPPAPPAERPAAQADEQADDDVHDATDRPEVAADQSTADRKLGADEPQPTPSSRAQANQDL